MIRALALTGGLACFLAGCAKGPGQPAIPERSAGEPLGLQMARTDEQMRKFPFLTLLDFELANDPVFIRADASAHRADESRAHTGAKSLVLEAPKSLTVRLPSLVGGTDFPGRWTLVGVYVHPSQNERVTASYEVEGRAAAAAMVQIPAGQWTPVLLDLSAAQASAKQIGVLKLTFADSSGPVWIDNVVVIDNVQTHVAKESGWTVSERGFTYLIERPPFFKASFSMPEAPKGEWRLMEANEIRVVLESKQNQKTQVLYFDGRSVLSGKMQSLVRREATEESLSQQHNSPAQLEISAEHGRVQRNAPGDANNDGYSELTGAYQLAASSPRIEFSLTPRTPQLVRPVVEIAGLPAGKVLATMEGRLVDRTARLESGNVLLELPGSINRTTTVSVRIAN
jgi:hypothetical protein